MKLSCVFLVFMVLVGCKPPRDGEGDRSSSDRGSADLFQVVGETAVRQAWTDDYRSGVEMRLLLERYFLAAHKVAPETLIAAAHSKGRLQPSQSGAVRLVESVLAPDVLRFRQATPTSSVPLVGFRAPLLEEEAELRDALSARATLAGADAAAASLVEERLARDGVLITLVRVLKVLGAAEAQVHPGAALRRLRRVGFPVDLIGCFSGGGSESPTVEELLGKWAARVSQGLSPESLAQQLRDARFHFIPREEGFVVATESGDEEIGMFRTQIGGGYSDGITPGGIIDLSAQLVAQFPQASFLISVPTEMRDDFLALVRNFWGLTRANHVTLVGEPGSVYGWPQDNGKAGVLASGSEVATLIPRYASWGEVPSEFASGESFLADGLAAAGHRVIHSSLLFQGGNVLSVMDAARHRRVLLLSEATLARNVALGLTSAEVLEAFAAEFGVEQCVVVPSVSHHLDFDVSVRTHQGGTIAFVNDPGTAVQIILLRGMDALATAGVLSGEAVEAARVALRDGRELALYEMLSRVVRRHHVQGAGYPAELARHFSVNPSDAAGLNFQSFLTALDFLGSRVLSSVETNGSDQPDHWALLRRVEERAGRQREVFRRLGWEVVPVPSLPDIGTPLNHLNGIHSLSSYIMPVHGGYYSALDRAATEKFREALGAEVRLIPIRVSACQQLQHGAVHCAAVAYPRLPQKVTPGT